MSDRRQTGRRVTLHGSGRHRAVDPIDNSTRRNTQDRRQADRRDGIERRRVLPRPPSLIGEIVRNSVDRRKD